MAREKESVTDGRRRSHGSVWIKKRSIIEMFSVIKYNAILFVGPEGDEEDGEDNRVLDGEHDDGNDLVAARQVLAHHRRPVQQTSLESS